MVVPTLDSAIHQINHYQQTSFRKTNCVIYWIEIYPVDSAIHVWNNWGQEVVFLMRTTSSQYLSIITERYGLFYSLVIMYLTQNCHKTFSNS